MPSDLPALLRRIDDAVEYEDHTGALQLILNNWYDLPDPAPLRERVALLLATEGRKREAVEIYELVARHYANAGFPTRALAAIKQMYALNPSSTQLLDQFTTLYSVRSPFLERGLRQAPIPEPPGSLKLEVNDSTDLDTLFEWAIERARDAEVVADRPGSLPALPLLSLLPPKALRRVLDFLEYEIYAESQPLLGDQTSEDDLFWAVSSDLVVQQQDEAYRIPAGTLLGLGQFRERKACSDYSVLSKKGSECLRLSRDAFDKLTDEFPDFPNRLAALYRHALTERLFARHPIFADLDEQARLELSSELMGLRLEADTALLQQDKVSPGLYVLLDGSVEVKRQSGSIEIALDTLGPGEIIGEVGLVDPRPAIVTAATAEPVHLLFFSREDFADFSRRHPVVAQRVQQRADRRIEEVRKTVPDS